LKYKNKLKKLKSYRSTLDSYWQEVADYCYPYDDFQTTREPGDQRNIDLYEERGVENTKSLASALQGMSTPMASRWFDLRYDGEASDELRGWFSTASKQIYNAIYVPRRQFNLSVHEMFLDMVPFGQGCVFIGRDDEKEDFFFSARNLRDCYIDLNERGKVDTLYYESKYSLAGLANMFGKDALHENHKRLLEEKPDHKVKVLHAVEPRHDSYGPGAKKDKKPYKSCYIDLENNHKLEESGFDQFPYVFPRFSKRSSEIYGHGPGMEALPILKMLNKLKEIMIRGGTKAVDPPFFAPAEGLLSPAQMDPGTITYYDPTMEMPQPVSNGYRPDYFEYLFNEAYQSIDKMFFVNHLNMPERPNMTATEVIRRTRESLQMMGPMLSRIHTEFHEPLIMRVFNIMMDMGMLPDLPEEVDDRKIVVEYTTPMDQAQRMEAANNVIQGIALAGQMAQFDEAAIDRLDTDAIMKDGLIEMYDWPAEYIRSDDKVDSMRKQRKQQGRLQSILQGSEAGLNIAKATGALRGQ